MTKVLVSVMVSKLFIFIYEIFKLLFACGYSKYSRKKNMYAFRSWMFTSVAYDYTYPQQSFSIICDVFI